MLDSKFVRENPDKARAALSARGGRHSSVLEKFLEVDAAWRKRLASVDALRAQRNKAADQIGLMKRNKQDSSSLLKEMESLKASMGEEESALGVLEKEVNDLLLSLPNIPLDSVPAGKTPQDNKVVREHGTKPSFSFKPKDHQDLGEALGILDFEAARKLSGARFALLKGKGAALERALIRFMLEVHTQEHGYTEILPPFLVTAQSMTGTGQLPKFAEELYKCADDDAYLIPTAEVPLTNLHRDETLDSKRLPISYCAWTACFRREAGTYGKDTRGLIRNHQFNKVELVKLTLPEDSEKQFESLTLNAEEILKRLGLPYRVLALCSGDLGFSSAKTYDLEVWMAGEGGWREISSCSTFTDFQARRIGLRYKTADGKKGLLHTLNGSGLAVGRTLAALLEHGQRADGSIEIPKVLEPYCGFSEIKGY